MTPPTRTPPPSSSRRPDAPAASPVRLRLSPGADLRRRDRDHLQVGLWPSPAAVVPDHPEVRALLEVLRGGLRPDGLATSRQSAALRCLVEAGLVGPVGEAVPGTLTDQDAGSAPGRRARRTRTGVAVSAPHGPATLAAATTEARRLLEAAGTRLVAEQDADVLLVVGAGEPERDALDPLVADRRPHLLLTALAGRVRVGPFVEPGRSACLRCVDQHRLDEDPQHALLLAQTGAEPEADPVLLGLGTAWAVHDLVAWVDGAACSTWSATLDLGPVPASRRWTRHPECPCTWEGA
ncbi:hypothetical protein [Nocardioides bruguierae]|uniref:Bacteriocin biosynthesis cyclodehydratase domain-containing protein n=1 Tax=Nocardioides bruguierae TaxID=2945102 RepID=A0A9X2D596_9ACTN|nr:hypothetical protein [Nocardioides bruguierae]MCM0619310.1 hypothetical protein [Nocardioides bruguierae]